MSYGTTIAPDVTDLPPIPATVALWRLQNAIDAAVFWQANRGMASPDFREKELCAAVTKASALIDLLCGP